jgi:ribosomal protein S18 acetylase RimI-like enzyme
VTSRIRTATSDDAGAIAGLHAESWRRFYRGVYSDRYLDGDLAGERGAVWAARLADPGPETITLICDNEHGLLGFVHVRLDADPEWGALLDNLHVGLGVQRQGVGSRLIQAAARAAGERHPGAGLYLWVQEVNLRAQEFYVAHGGRIAGREPVGPPAGDPRNLAGSPFKLRVAWPDAACVARASS